MRFSSMSVGDNPVVVNELHAINSNQVHNLDSFLQTVLFDGAWSKAWRSGLWRNVRGFGLFSSAGRARDFGVRVFRPPGRATRGPRGPDRDPRPPISLSITDPIMDPIVEGSDHGSKRRFPRDLALKR